MIITEINKQKRSGRYNIFVDGEFYSGLDEETIVKASLKTGTEIQKEKLEELVFESERHSAFEKIANLISRQMYSERDLKNKLFKYGYSDVVIESAIDLAKEYKYISDSDYAVSFVESKPLKSRIELKNALFQKGICSYFAENALKNISFEDEFSRAEQISAKYMKNKEICQKTYAGLYTFLMRKGYPSEIINKILKKYKFEID